MKSKKRCPRSWEVEAARNGQLLGAKLHAHREHLASGCGDCNQQLQALALLGQQLCALEATQDELALRRLRQVTLEAAQAEHCEARRPRTRQRVAVLACVAAASVGIGSFGFLSQRSAPHPKPAGSVVVVTPLDRGSVFHQRRERDVERVELSEGVFSLVVRRGPHDPRVLVSIPEGEIEDLGTVFSVAVHGGYTTRIAVTQGAVVLRRRDLPELHLGTGSVWERVSNSEVKPVVVPPSAALDAEPVKLAPPPSAAGVAKKTPAHAKPARVTPPPTATEPADEDNTYLELIRLVRERRSDEAQRVASDYLKRFPDGFRREDVERVLNPVARGALAPPKLRP